MKRAWIPVSAGLAWLLAAGLPVSCSTSTSESEDGGPDSGAHDAAQADGGDETDADSYGPRCCVYLDWVIQAGGALLRCL